MTASTSGYGSVLLGNPGQSRRRLRIRVQVLLTVLLVSTNVIGAGIVFVLSAVVIPSPAANRGTVLSLAIGVPVYVGIAVVVGAAWGTAGALRSLRWATREDEPSDEQRVEALGVPWFLTKVQATPCSSCNGSRSASISRVHSRLSCGVASTRCPPGRLSNGVHLSTPDAFWGVAGTRPR